MNSYYTVTSRVKSDSPAVLIQDLKVEFNNFTLSVDKLECNLGQSIAILGKNGSGKSVFVKSILNLVKPSTGSIQVLGNKFTPRSHSISYVPQVADIDIDFPISAIDVVLMGMCREYGLFGFITKQHRRRAIDVMDIMGIAGIANRRIGGLSSGQQQRVFIARALANKAPIFIMDEPFNNVDINTRDKIMDVIEYLKGQNHLIICVHHEANLDGKFNRNIVINQGKIYNDTAA